MTERVQECPAPDEKMPRFIVQDSDETLRFYFDTEQQRDAYVTAPDPGVAVLDVGGPDAPPDWATGSPYWARALTAPLERR